MPQQFDLKIPDDEINKIRFENWQCFMLKKMYMQAWLSPNEDEWQLLAYMLTGPAGWSVADPDKIVNMLKARWQ